MKKPVHIGTYFLGIMTGSYALSVHSLTGLIISIILLFHAFMSGDTIKEPGDQ